MCKVIHRERERERENEIMFKSLFEPIMKFAKHLRKMNTLQITEILRRYVL